MIFWSCFTQKIPETQHSRFLVRDLQEYMNSLKMWLSQDELTGTLPKRAKSSQVPKPLTVCSLCSFPHVLRNRLVCVYIRLIKTTLRIQNQPFICSLKARRDHHLIWFWVSWVLTFNLGTPTLELKQWDLAKAYLPGRHLPMRGRNPDKKAPIPLLICSYA